MPRKKQLLLIEDDPERAYPSPHQKPLSLRPGLAIVLDGCVEGVAEACAIRDSYRWSAMGMPVRFVDSWDDPILAREGEVTFAS